ncbi:MAG: hypothetical protein VKP57_12625 [Candidatus Sericytochromatia bacterium]|nr:hypothetical protein [Candidatus Sericytochromatia bacterium]
MRVILALTPDQAEAIDRAWFMFERYDNPQIGRDCGYATAPGGARWLDDNGDLSAIHKDAEGTWTFRYEGSRNGAGAFYATGVDWKQLPVLAYIADSGENPGLPWWQKTNEAEKQEMLAFTRTDLKAPRVPKTIPDYLSIFPCELEVHTWESEPYWFMTYFLDGVATATRFVTDFRRELAAIDQDTEACIRELTAFRDG